MRWFWMALGGLVAPSACFSSGESGSTGTTDHVPRAMGGSGAATTEAGPGSSAGGRARDAAAPPASTGDAAVTTDVALDGSAMSDCERFVEDRLSAPCDATFSMCRGCATELLACTADPQCRAYVECSHELYRMLPVGTGSFSEVRFDCSTGTIDSTRLVDALSDCLRNDGLSGDRCGALSEYHCADACVSVDDCGQNVTGGACTDGPSGTAQCRLRCENGICPRGMTCEEDVGGSFFCTPSSEVHRPQGPDEICCVGEGGPCGMFGPAPCCDGLTCEQVAGVADRCVPTNCTVDGGASLLETLLEERRLNATCVTDADCTVEYDLLCGSMVEGTTFGCFSVRGAGGNDDAVDLAEAELAGLCWRGSGCSCPGLPAVACSGGVCEATN